MSRGRVKFSADALIILEDTFAAQPFPTNVQFDDLAEKTGETKYRLRTWFSNRRAREKRLNNGAALGKRDATDAFGAGAGHAARAAPGGAVAPRNQQAQALFNVLRAAAVRYDAIIAERRMKKDTGAAAARQGGAEAVKKEDDTAGGADEQAPKTTVKVEEGVPPPAPPSATDKPVGIKTEPAVQPTTTSDAPPVAAEPAEPAGPADPESAPTAMETEQKQGSKRVSPETEMEQLIVEPRLKKQRTLGAEDWEFGKMRTVVTSLVRANASDNIIVYEKLRLIAQQALPFLENGNAPKALLILEPLLHSIIDVKGELPRARGNPTEELVIYIGRLIIHALLLLRDNQMGINVELGRSLTEFQRRLRAYGDDICNLMIRVNREPWPMALGVVLHGQKTNPAPFDFHEDVAVAYARWKVLRHLGTPSEAHNFALYCANGGTRGPFSTHGHGTTSDSMVFANAVVEHHLSVGEYERAAAETIARMASQDAMLQVSERILDQAIVTRPMYDAAYKIAKHLLDRGRDCGQHTDRILKSLVQALAQRDDHRELIDDLMDTLYTSEHFLALSKAVWITFRPHNIANDVNAVEWFVTLWENTFDRATSPETKADFCFWLGSQAFPPLSNGMARICLVSAFYTCPDLTVFRETSRVLDLLQSSGVEAVSSRMRHALACLRSRIIFEPARDGRSMSSILTAAEQSCAAARREVLSLANETFSCWDALTVSLETGSLDGCKRAAQTCIDEISTRISRSGRKLSSQGVGEAAKLVFFAFERMLVDFEEQQPAVAKWITTSCHNMLTKVVRLGVTSADIDTLVNVAKFFILAQNSLPVAGRDYSPLTDTLFRLRDRPAIWATFKGRFQACKSLLPNDAVDATGANTLTILWG